MVHETCEDFDEKYTNLSQWRWRLLHQSGGWNSCRDRRACGAQIQNDRGCRGQHRIHQLCHSQGLSHVSNDQCASTILLTLWYTLKFIVTLLATSQRTSLGLEFAHSHGGKGSSSVVSGGVVVNLVDWNCGVHDVGLDDLLLNNWLNGLVDMLGSIRMK